MGLALEEPVYSDSDVTYEDSCINVVYEKRLSPFIAGKVIDYEEGARSGFIVIDEGRSNGCSSC